MSSDKELNKPEIVVNDGKIELVSEINKKYGTLSYDSKQDQDVLNNSKYDVDKREFQSDKSVRLADDTKLSRTIEVPAL